MNTNMTTEQAVANAQAKLALRLLWRAVARGEDIVKAKACFERAIAETHRVADRW